MTRFPTRTGNWIRQLSHSCDFKEGLLKNGPELASVKKAYLALARKNHPDANPDDAEAAQRFVELGRTYEAMVKRLKAGSDEGRNGLEDHEDDDEEDYGEEEARTTFSGAGGPVLTKQMRKELKKVSEEMSSGGARDGGWYLLAQQYGGDDGIQELPGGPNISGEPMAISDGRKPRRRRK